MVAIDPALMQVAQEALTNLILSLTILGLVIGGAFAWIIYRTYALEKQIRVLSSAIEANLFKKRNHKEE